MDPPPTQRENKGLWFTWKNRKPGGWRPACVLLANQCLVTLAFFGAGVNLVLFLTRVLGQHNAEAANSVSKWTGTVYLFSLVGAFLSDSYWGRYLTCTIFQIIMLIGLGLLSLSSSIFLITPAGCGDGKLACDKPSAAGVVVFYFSIYLIALGYGGHQPTIATLGADQFDELNPRDLAWKEAFFCYFYFALNSGSLFSNTILVYCEDSGKWTLGFLISLGAFLVALISFLLASPMYRHVTPCGNPLPRVAQVFVAAARKYRVEAACPDALYEVEGAESAIKGSRKIKHSKHFPMLDKAATITPEDESSKANPWQLCTTSQVEEAKSVLKLLPIWLCTIVYSIAFTQMASMFIEQGDVMNTLVKSFRIPAASMSAFDICSVLICTAVYRKLVVPVAGRVRGNQKGLSELQRMGVGLVIGLLSMVAAGHAEIQRLRDVTRGEKRSELSIFWQVPQYVLLGISEVFMYVGQLEFFNGQAPDGIKSLGSSLCMASIAIGNYASCLLVNAVMSFTAKGKNLGWIPHDLNMGHMDRFYFLIAAMCAVDFVFYLMCANWYKPIILYESNKSRRSVQEDEEEEDEDEALAVL